jgi:hypothetical protein
MYMAPVQFEGSEQQPAPVPRTPASVHRNIGLLQLTKVAIFSCSYRVPSISSLLLGSSITWCNIGEDICGLYINSLIPLTECNLAVDENNKPDLGRGTILLRFHCLVCFMCRSLFSGPAQSIVSNGDLSW